MIKLTVTITEKWNITETEKKHSQLIHRKMTLTEK